MEKEKFNKLRKLEDDINRVQSCLNMATNENLKVGYFSTVSLDTICFSMPEDLSDEIRNCMKNWVNKKQIEFNELIDDKETTKDKEPTDKEPTDKNTDICDIQVSKPWYKFW